MSIGPEKVSGVASVQQRDNEIENVRSGRPGAEEIFQVLEKVVGVVFTQGLSRIEPQPARPDDSVSIDKGARGIRWTVTAVTGGA